MVLPPPQLRLHMRLNARQTQIILLILLLLLLLLFLPAPADVSECLEAAAGQLLVLEAAAQKLPLALLVAAVLVSKQRGQGAADERQVLPDARCLRLGVPKVALGALVLHLRAQDAQWVSIPAVRCRGLVASTSGLASTSGHLRCGQLGGASATGAERPPSFILSDHDAGLAAICY